MPKCCAKLFNERSNFWTGVRAAALDILRQDLVDLDAPPPPPLFPRRASMFNNGPTQRQQIDQMVRDCGREADIEDMARIRKGGFAGNATALGIVMVYKPAQVYRLMR
jgi:hypothetical protein